MRRDLENNASFQNEFTPGKENQIFDENVIIKENAQVKEVETPEEENDTVMEKNDRGGNRKTIQAFSGGLIAVVAAATVGLTSLVNVTMKANFVDDKMVYRDGSLFYEVKAENMTEKEYLTLYTFNDGNQIDSLKLVDDDNDGLISGEIKLNNEEIQSKLAQNPDLLITYKFTLKGMVGLDVERSFDNYTLEIRNATAEILNVERECHCGETGYYNFKVNFNDPFGTFYNFTAYIVTKDANGNDYARGCTWTDNPHDWQGIYVADLGAMTGKLIISMDSTIGENNGYYGEFDIRF